MRNEWTGGQYSVYRALLGLYLFVHFSYLIPWAPELFSSAGMLPAANDSPLLKAFPNVLGLIDSPATVISLCVAAAGAAILFGIGYLDRAAALFIWFVLACFFGRNPLIANPSLPYVGWMLLTHVFMSPAPYGSLAARGRIDPGDGWYMPDKIFLAAWVVLAVSYSYSGYTKLLSPSWMNGDNVAFVLDNPLARDWLLRSVFLALPGTLLRVLTWFILGIETLFALFALSGRARPFAWGAMLFVQFGFALLLNFPDLTMAMLLFHLLTFNPGWIKARAIPGQAGLFLDGDCALGAGFSRFVTAEDRTGRITVFPIDQRRFRTELADAKLVLAMPNGRLLLKSDAVIECLHLLGGLWRVFAVILQAVPKPARDRVHEQIARRLDESGGRREAGFT